MRTAFKDNDLQVYGLRVVEPHHDGTPHWHMMLFCNPRQRNQIIEIMRRYALKEDGDERGAARNRFQAKHLNRGGAAGYIAKYISKNIDGYALDGQLNNDTGRPLKDTAAAVTAWASTWRIPQFKTVGLPTMGAYRELRKLPRGVSIADEFDERVEAARAAQTVVILRCISARRAGQMSRAIVRLSGSPVARRMTLTSMRKKSREWSAFTRRISARVIFISPERRTGALCRKFRSLSP
ncbi:bacteriophage replication A family protein [Escherichia coli p0305293.11]|nr:bacteriophage replication A family protein [Escherichia coli p0305293.11]